MKVYRLVLPFVAFLLFAGAGKKPDLAVRMHAEANQQDTTTFALPAELLYPTPHTAYMERVPRISERDIKSIFITPASDGTFGCAFKLNETGRLHLEVLSTELRGKSLVVLLQTKNAPAHQLPDLVIDSKITDGVIYVPHGITALEIKVLEKEFHVANPKK